MRVLIDGDPIVYRAGFAGENHWKILRWADAGATPDDDEVHEAFFAYMKELHAFREYMNIHDDEYTVSTVVDPLPEQFALRMVKTSLQTTVRAVEGYLTESGRKVDEVVVFLSGSTNFRNAVATIPGSWKDGEPCTGYKANRKDSTRPYWYARIREYMIEVWKAHLIEGIEADDALAIEQWAHDEYDPKTIICTIDKDLRNVPGEHYHIMKKETVFVSHKDAMVNFWRQVLTGDPTDNIPGCYRIGKSIAEKLITEDMDEHQMYEVCLERYEENIVKYPDRYGHYGGSLWPTDEGAEKSLLENARLLWMLQHRDQLWTPPGQPDESIMEAGLLDVEDEFA